MSEEVKLLQPDPEAVSLNREDETWREHLLQLWHTGKKKELQKFLEELYPADIAFLIENLEFEEGLPLFEGLELEIRGEVLAELHETTCEKYLQALSPQALADVLAPLPSDRATDLLEKLEKPQINSVLDFLPEAQRIRIIELLGYPENTAGAIMTKEYVAVHLNDTIQKAISALRHSQQKDNIHTIFVVNEEGRYQGHLSLTKLILARPQSKVKRVMEQELMPIPVNKDQEEVAQFFTRYDFITAPVISSVGTLLGHITADDVLQVVQKEASEDILGMGGLAQEESIDAPILRSSLRRAAWLVLNLLTAFLSAAVIRLFDQAIEKALLLAALMPIVASIGGSAGGQSMVLAIRSIALGELPRDQMLRRLLHEFLIALFNGFFLGAVAALVVYLLTQSLLLTGTLFFALMGNILVAAFLGTLIPQFLRYFKIDPAIGSVILVTACTDIIGFTLFLGLAYMALEFTSIL